ncbi:MAG: PepSY domain-containing protein, partial [Pirellula sp.]
MRETLLVNVSDGTIASREVFSQKHWLDKVVGIGIAAHEGQLFGIANQILGALTTTGLIALSCSGLWMWWRRRETGTLGIPPPLSQARLVWSVWIGIIMLGIAMPLFGATLLVVLIIDRLVKIRSVGHRDFK